MSANWCSCEGCTRLEIARPIPTAVLRVVAANLAAFERVARVLTFGADKHPGGSLGPDGRQTAEDHLAAAERHRWVRCNQPMPDPETGEAPIVHEVARLILAIGMERR